MNAPCKDCPDRNYMCHSTCEKYIEYQKHREEVRKKKQEFYRQDYDYVSSRKTGLRRRK